MELTTPRVNLRRITFAIFLSASLICMAAKAPEMQPPDDKTAKQIHQKTEELRSEVESLRAANTPDSKLVDVEVFLKAAVWAQKHDEWYKDYAKWTVSALDRGLERAGQLKAGQTPWLHRQGTIYRGYRSDIDESVQPYQIILPKDYPGANKQWRLDLVLHGRDDTINEVKFLHPGDSTRPAPDQDFIELHVFGRGNNAYRWAGESDTFEAINAFRAGERETYGREMVDSNRIVLRGFSMGGAGAWHLGLQHPSFWCSASPGAGFTATFGRVKDPTGKLPDYVVKCLGFYDAIDYAENVFDVPVVAYGGEIDPQREAMEAIRDKITPLGLHATFLVGPKMGHKYDPESLKTIMKMQGEDAAKGRDPFPAHVRFVTMTPAFSDCFWVRVLCQEHQYQRSLVDADRKEDGLHVKTENVRALELAVPEDWKGRKGISIDVDGQVIHCDVGESKSSSGGYLLANLIRSPQGWERIELAELSKDKAPGQTGPIDDAFMSPFICIRGTGKPWNEALAGQANAELERFQREWSKYIRGEIPLIDDTQAAAANLEGKNLILFGDGGSNAMIRELLPQLPIQWTADELVANGVHYKSAENMPALIYPNPRDPGRYIVLNSGHTFHEPEFKNTNRMLYPHLGDWAVMPVGPIEKSGPTTQPVSAGLFDENWKWPGTTK